MKRVRFAIVGLFCFALVGCVEGEITYTMNPDGATKIRMDIVTIAPPTFGGGPPGPMGKNPQDETIDDMLRKTLRSMLENPKVVAWKDVSAEFTPNGKFKFGGTAYVRQLPDYARQGGSPLLNPQFKLDRTPDGGMKLIRKEDSDQPGKPDPNKRKPKTPDEIKKLTDEQLDAEILHDLIDLQSAKGILIAMLTDCKMKTTFVLPGDVTAVVGFVKDGRKASYTVDGNKIIADVNKLLTEDRPTLRKFYRSATSPDVFKNRVLGESMNEGSITVAKPGEPLFDFDKEVKEAHAAYPDLRKKFGFGDELKLPTGEAFPKK
ncbi:MAG: hypothetical protein K8U57_11475 [Planctomycetes bacterium]|nr:hypothetical protein [Planctomycetota bacterium]